MKQPSIWEIIRDFINSLEIGCSFTRKEILDRVEVYYQNNRKCWYNNSYIPGKPIYSYGTVDGIITMSKNHTKYIRQSDKNGKYIVMKHFHHDLTCTRLRKEYETIYKNLKLS